MGKNENSPEIKYCPMQPFGFLVDTQNESAPKLVPNADMSVPCLREKCAWWMPQKQYKTYYNGLELTADIGESGCGMVMR